MYAFNSGGRQFQISIDVFAARRIKQATGLSVETLIQPEHAEKWDRVALFEALVAACEPGKLGVSDQEFARILSDGDTAEIAAEQFQKAVIDFLPQRQRSLMHSLLSKQKKLKEETLEAAPAVMNRVLEMQSQAIKDAQSRLLSSHLPGSQESTRPD